MGNSSLGFAFLLLLLEVLFPTFLISAKIEVKNGSDASPFPPNFLFGTASSSYQYEGAFLTDGKGLNNWDVFTHNSVSVANESNGDVAVDQYHRYLEYVDLMASFGLNSYQFSISWARILPRGRYGSINFAGIDHYNSLINALLLRGIQPFVVLSHFDIPDELEQRYGAWLSPKLVEDFKFFADICFKNFGDRVKYWVTFSEPNLFVICAYRSGIFPPSRCSKPFGICSDGDSETEPFIAAHNIILAHAAAVKVYKTKYQGKQGGIIGLIVHAAWFEPLTNSTADKLAAERAQSFISNWFLDPIVFGRYPKEMNDLLGSTLPKFSRNNSDDLKLGVDFIGINHYTSLYVGDCLYTACEQPSTGSTRTEGFIKQTNFKDGIPIGELTGNWPLRSYPPGIEKSVTYIKERYNNIPIVITENGYCDKTNPNSTFEELLNDVKRVEYLSHYLDYLSIAMRKGADVRGYFVWTLLDAYEWLSGYTKRFGLHHVDHVTLKNTPKASATWYKEFIAKHKTTQLAQY